MSNIMTFLSFGTCNRICWLAWVHFCVRIEIRVDTDDLNTDGTMII